MNAHAKAGACAVVLSRAVVGRAKRQWSAGSFAAFVMDAADPLGAAIIEMLAWFNLGFFLRGEKGCSSEARGFIVGAVSLTELRIIVAGLADADRGLVAIGERRETPGAGKLLRALCAHGPLAVFVGEGLRRVRRLNDDGPALAGRVLRQYAVRHS